jgi:rhodanese-related sulfurtransferase
MLSAPGIFLILTTFAGPAPTTAPAGMSLKEALRTGSLEAVEEVVRARFPDVRQMSTAELAERMAGPEASRPVLLDARAEAEFAVSHLHGAIRVDFDTRSLPPAVQDLPRDRPVVVYCSVGWRSSLYARRLAGEGFADVSNLSGSAFRWALEGRPLVAGGRPSTVVHPYNDEWGALVRPELRSTEPAAPTAVEEARPRP